MIIREAKESDIPALSKVAKKTYTETFGDGLTTEQLTTVLETTRSETYFKSIINKDTIIVALINDKLIGYIQISDIRYKTKKIKTSKKDQAIHSIYILPDYQSKGIGKTLMDTAFNHPRIKKANRIFIDVYEKNTRALNFYKKYGFKTAGNVEVIIDGKPIGHDLVLMKTTKN